MKFSLVILSIILLVINLQVQAADRCLALVIEGGADLGAFEAGAIQAFAYNLNGTDSQYDVFSGISVGAITSAGINQFPKGQEKDMADWVVSLWRQIVKTNVYKNHSPGGLVQGLLFEQGIFDNTPLKEFLPLHLSQPPQRKIVIGATDINTGQLKRFNESLSGSALMEAVVASAAVPAVFPQQVVDGVSYFDGGVAHMMDIAGAVNRCREIVDDDSKIIIDTLMIVAEESLEQWPPNADKKTFGVYQRSNSMATIEKSFKEYREATEIYPYVKFRYLVKPSKKLPDADFPFFFVKAQIEQMIKQGYDDAIAVINKGEGVAHKEFLKQAYAHYFKKIDPNFQIPQQKQQEILEL